MILAAACCVQALRNMSAIIRRSLLLLPAIFALLLSFTTDSSCATMTVRNVGGMMTATTDEPIVPLSRSLLAKGPTPPV